MPGRVIQILGMAGSVGAVPDIPGAERWCSNNPRVYRVRCPQARKTWTRWFNMHSMKHILKKYPNGHQWLQENANGRVVYLRDEVDPAIPTSQVFPGPMLMAYFGNHGQPEAFFTFSGAWFAAFALWEHLEVDPIAQVQWWGIEMRREHQWAFERPAMHYWCGRLEEAGIEVLIPEGVDVLKHRTGASLVASVLNEALVVGFTDVDLRGAEWPTELVESEASYYLLGRLRQRGTRVQLPPGIAVAAKLYGYETT